MNVDGVLLDWRGTLAVTPTEEAWVRQGLLRTGGDPAPAHVDSVFHALERALSAEDVREVWARLDCSEALHRNAYERLFAAAGLDAALAAALYQIESDPEGNPFSVDAVPTLRSLREAGVRVAIVSDIHFDIRPVFEKADLADAVDAFVLSFERGVQKPNPAVFRLALAELGVEPARALMVGDRAAYDGGALAVGIPTLLLPSLRAVDDERLHVVLAACGVDRG